jgi:quercetin dioxygenase-like cupin family protein
MKSKIVPSYVAGALILAFCLIGIAQTKSDAPQKVIIVPPGEGKMSAPGEWKIVGEQSNGALALVEIKAPSAAPYTSPHMHTREDEAWYVIDGELTFEVGGRKATAGPGTFVWAPRNIPHRYRVSKAPARWLLMLSPAGMEPLFGEVAELQKRIPKGSSAEYETELHKLQPKYGVQPVAEPPSKEP